MYRFSVLSILALLCATQGFAQTAPPSPGSATVLPPRAEVLAERAQRLTRLPIPEPLRTANRDTPEVLTEANAYESDGEWIHYWRTTHTYAGLLRHISTHYGQLFERDLEPNYRSERSYDGQNRLTEIRYDGWAGEAFIPNWLSVHSYTGSFVVPTTVIHQWHDGSAWQNDSRDTFTVSGSGTYFTAVQIDEWDGGSWNPYARSTLANVDGGVTFTSEDWMGDAWVYESRAFVPGVTIPELVDLLVSLGAMEEDLVGLLLPIALIPDHTFEYWNGGEWVPDTRQTSEHHYHPQSGALVRVETLVEVYVIDAWEVDVRLVRTFDLNDDDLLDLLELQYLEFDEWVTFLVEEYTYTDTGRLASGELSLIFDDGEHPARDVVVIPLALSTFSWTDAPVSTEDPATALIAGIDALYPNPAREGSVIRFSLLQAGRATLAVYDALGRRVAILADGPLGEGPHEARFDATHLPAGLYFVRLDTEAGRSVRPVTVLH